MRYHPRIQTAALKVGFHALLLHKYSKRLQTYSQVSRLLLLNNECIFNYMVYNNKVQRIKVLPKKSYYFCSHALIERPKINPQLLQNNLYMGLSYFPFFIFLNFLSLRPKENI